eukprot:12918873-Prorocentrum_lima.AAC.1
MGRCRWMTLVTDSGDTGRCMAGSVRSRLAMAKLLHREAHMNGLGDSGRCMRSFLGLAKLQ